MVLILESNAHIHTTIIMNIYIINKKMYIDLISLCSAENTNNSKIYTLFKHNNILSDKKH
jgi:hypothetical protein